MAGIVSMAIAAYFSFGLGVFKAISANVPEAQNPVGLIITMILWPVPILIMAGDKVARILAR